MEARIEPQHQAVEELVQPTKNLNKEEALEGNEKPYQEGKAATTKPQSKESVKPVTEAYFKACYKEGSVFPIRRSVKCMMVDAIASVFCCQYPTPSSEAGEQNDAAGPPEMSKDDESICCCCCCCCCDL